MALKFLGKASMREKPASGHSPLSFAHSLDKLALLKCFFRLLQVIMAIVVASMYGRYLVRAHHAGKYMDSKWVYAVVVATLSGATALTYMFLVRFKTWYAFGWDAAIWILYLALFGIFGNMYIKEDPEGNSDIQYMKNAVWIDLTNMLMWFITACWGAWQFWKARKARTSLTGRAEQHP